MQPETEWRVDSILTLVAYSELMLRLRRSTKSSGPLLCQSTQPGVSRRQQIQAHEVTATVYVWAPSESFWSDDGKLGVGLHWKRSLTLLIIQVWCQ